MGVLINIVNSILAYNDAQGVNSNPLQRAVDWSRRYNSIAGKNVTSDFASLAPGESKVLFDGSQSLPQAFSAGTTVLSLSQLDTSTSIYRLKVTTGPGQFRTPRTTSLGAASQITVAVNNNSIATFTISTGPGTFSSVQVGDVLRIKGFATGELSNNVFSAVNSGYWTVLSATSTVITVRRPLGESFQGVGEVVTIGATLTSEQLMVYSSSGIQTSDSFLIQGSFSSASWNAYDIQQVGPDFIDFISGIPLPLESSILLGSVDDILFYGNAKKVLYIEVDQESAIQCNGESSQSNIIEPIQVGNDTLVGFFNKIGFTWKCVVVNRSTVDTMQIKWITSE